MEVPASGQVRRLKAGAFVDAADGSGLLAARGSMVVAPRSSLIRTLAEAASLVLEWLSNAALHGHDLLAQVDATVHRIVHGGAAFRASTRLG
jgi:acetate kinase